MSKKYSFTPIFPSSPYWQSQFKRNGFLTFITVIFTIILLEVLATSCGVVVVQGTPQSSATQPPVTVNSAPTSGDVCRGERDYPITDTISGLSSGFYRIEFYVGTGPENESWLPAGPGVSYKVNSNVNGHIWEFPSASCTRKDVMDDAIATHRRRSAEGYTVSSSSYTDPSDSLVASNFIKQ